MWVDVEDGCLHVIYLLLPLRVRPQYHYLESLCGLTRGQELLYFGGNLAYLLSLDLSDGWYYGHR